MEKQGKLELTWVGKYEEEKLEPRIFIEDEQYSYGDTSEGNMLIHGDNLIALEALQQEYTDKIKCIYIDPPYNTGSAFEHYDDGVEHSIWLSLMRKRLILLRNLLSDDGFIFVQIDNNEMAYLKILMDEIFGRNNFVNDIVWKRKGGSVNPKNRLNNNTDYILWYAKSDKATVYPVYTLEDEETQEYIKKRFTHTDENGRKFRLSPIISPTYSPTLVYEYKGYKPPKNGWSLSLSKMQAFEAEGRLYMPENKEQRIQRKQYLDEYKGRPIGNLWTDINVINPMSTERLEFVGQKPEVLIERILLLSTQEGDLVLDSFLGSGTTMAVAHKMKRKWIGIELGDQCFSHDIPRIKKVVDGMGACIYYLYKTKGYKHFFILCPSNTIYDKMRRETVPGHPKYMFKGLEAEMGRPKVYDGENYLSYPVRYVQSELQIEKTSEIQLFIFNISKIFTRGDLEFKFHKFNENLGGSFADVLRSFDDLVFCMDEAHRYYAPASKTAINYLNPVLGLEFTATPKSTNKNIIFHYGLEEGAGKFLKIPVVMGRTNTAGYSDDDIEEMKLKDGIKLHERRKAIVYKYCIDNGLEQVKPIVLVACKDTTHAKKIKEKIDSDAFFGGRYVGKVIEIDSSTRGEETEENIQKLLTIEQNTNPVEIVLHVYKLKEGWDVNNLFTIIPLNAAKSDILALQTIGRGLRLPFGEITHVEEIDTLDIVAHDHYREIIDDIKDNPVFKKRNLDDEDIPETEAVKVEAVVQDQQISIFDDMFKDANVKSFQEIDTNKDIDNLYEAYQKAYVKKAAPKKKDSKPDGQITIFDLFGSGDDTNSDDTGSKEEQAPTDTTVSKDNISIF